MAIAQNVVVNQEIKASAVRLILPDGSQKGIVPLEDALRTAREMELDLVQVSIANDGTPVCKIMDYGKYQYQLSKSQRKQRSHSKKSEVKGIRLGFATAKHDMEVKAKKAEKFLKQGHRVKVTLIFRGRQITHFDLGIQKLMDFAELLAEAADVVDKPSKQGRSLHLMLKPK